MFQATNHQCAKHLGKHFHARQMDGTRRQAMELHRSDETSCDWTESRPPLGPQVSLLGEQTYSLVNV